MAEALARSPLLPAAQPDLENPTAVGRRDADHLVSLIANHRLAAVFQPILDFRAHAYIGFEALIRGPVDSPCHTPCALFGTADRHGLRQELERACRATIFTAFAQARLPGKLFINASLGSLDDEEIGRAHV